MPSCLGLFRCGNRCSRSLYMSFHVIVGMNEQPGAKSLFYQLALNRNYIYSYKSSLCYFNTNADGINLQDEGQAVASNEATVS